MAEYNRRTIVAMSLGSAAALCAPPSLIAATQCVTGPLPGFLPNNLSVDCASRRNFRTFRQYPDYVCLVGVVSMTSVRGKLGTYPAGNLFLFPQLTAKGKGKTLPAVCPTNLTAYVNSSPIPDATLPIDDYFCRFVLQAPWTSFIGFEVGKLYGAGQNNFPWFTNVDKLADGSGVGIDWTSANLNNPWFGGTRWIPNTATCDGAAWRKLIVRGLNQASVGACSTA